MWKGKYKKVSLKDFNNESEGERLDPFAPLSTEPNVEIEAISYSRSDSRLEAREPLLNSRTQVYLNEMEDATMFDETYETGDLTTASLISHPLQNEPTTSYGSLDNEELEEDNNRFEVNVPSDPSLVHSSNSSLPSSPDINNMATFSHSEFRLPPPPPAAVLARTTPGRSNANPYSHFSLFSRLKPWSNRKPANLMANDGVFFNLNAKPAPVGSPILTPQSPDEEETETRPESERLNGSEFNTSTSDLPNYRQALDEPSPPSFDLLNSLPSWAHPRSRGDRHDDLEDPTIDGLPLGSLVVFVITLFFSSLLQFVGFVLTYLVHTDHAGRLGSLAGLGVTFLQVGYGLRNNILSIQLGSQNFKFNAMDAFVIDPTYGGTAPAILIISYVLMALGWFFFFYGVTTFLNYSQIKHNLHSSHPQTASRPLV